MDFKLLYSLYLSTKYKSKAIVFSSDIWRQSGHSPAMKQTKHICGVNNLVEEMNNVESKQEWLWNRIYNLFAVHVKLLKLKGNASWENTEKDICMTAWNLFPKKGF